MAAGITDAEWQRGVDERQQRINQAVRELDTLIVRLGHLARDGGPAQNVALDQAVRIQANLRGK